MDAEANSSTVTEGRLSGFGGAPNMGHDPRGRRHPTPAWLDLHYGEGAAMRGRKLVVQIVQTFQSSGTPTFVESLDAIEFGKKAGMALPPVMIYGDDVSHIVTEEGIANLLLCRTPEEREQAIRGVAGYTDVGRKRDRRAVENLRDRGIVTRAEDLGIDKREATRDWLAARSIKDLVRISGGLYRPPARFRNW
jgi:malonate decarboxylase alpha subunit